MKKKVYLIVFKGNINGYNCIDKKKKKFRNFIRIIYVRCNSSFKNYFFTNFQINFNDFFCLKNKYKKKLLRIADSIKKKARCTGITAGGIKWFNKIKKT